MCLSSVYKEKALGDDDMDVIYLNGWVAVFQFLASLLFAVPSAYAMGLPVAVRFSTAPTLFYFVFITRGGEVSTARNLFYLVFLRFILSYFPPRCGEIFCSSFILFIFPFPFPWR